MSRRGRKLIGWVISSALALALPGPAYADNCSGLSDCYGQIIAAVLVVLAIVAIILIIAFLPEILAFVAASGITFGEGLGFAAAAYDAWTLGEDVAVAEHEEGAKGVANTVARFAVFSAIGAGLGHLFGGALSRGWARLFGREAAEAGASRLGREMVGAVDEVTVNSNVARMERLIAAKNKLPFNVTEFNPLRGDVNCAAVTHAVDTTMAGIPRVAGGNPVGELVTRADMEYWYGKRFTNVTYDDIQNAFEGFGPNSRGIILVDTPGNPTIVGHGINVVNVNGEVIYVDAQRGIASSNIADLLPDIYTRIRVMITSKTP